MGVTKAGDVFEFEYGLEGKRMDSAWRTKIFSDLLYFIPEDDNQFGKLHTAHKRRAEYLNRLSKVNNYHNSVEYHISKMTIQQYNPHTK